MSHSQHTVTLKTEPLRITRIAETSKGSFPDSINNSRKSWLNEHLGHKKTISYKITKTEMSGKSEITKKPVRTNESRSRNVENVQDTGIHRHNESSYK